MAPTVAEGQIRVIPSVTVSERYDTNVFFGFAAEGVNPKDYVSNVSPQVKVEHKGPLIDWDLTGGGTGEAYVNNPGLNYFGANGALNLDLDRAVGQLVRGAGLKLSDAFLYTPQPPAFLAPGLTGPTSNPFVRGIQAFRVNSISNNGSVTGSYAFSTDLSFMATYAHSLLRFGKTFAPDTTTDTTTTTPGVGSVFDTTMQTITAGPEARISSLDMVGLTYQHLHFEFGTGETTSEFTTDGAMATWSRGLTPELKAKVAGGVAVLKESNDLLYTAEASLAWTSPSTTMLLQFSRGIIPSFFLTPTPLLSQVLTASLSHKLTEDLSIIGNADYAYNESVTAQPAVFESYFATLGLSYTITRPLTATLSYTYSEFINSGAGGDFSFKRDVIMFSLRAEWK